MKFVKVMARDTWLAVLDLIYRLCHMFVEWYYDFLDSDRL